MSQFPRGWWGKATVRDDSLPHQLHHLLEDNTIVSLCSCGKWRRVGPPKEDVQVDIDAWKMHVEESQ